MKFLFLFTSIQSHAALPSFKSAAKKVAVSAKRVISKSCCYSTTTDSDLEDAPPAYEKIDKSMSNLQVDPLHRSVYTTTESFQKLDLNNRQNRTPYDLRPLGYALPPLPTYQDSLDDYNSRPQRPPIYQKNTLKPKVWKKQKISNVLKHKISNVLKHKQNLMSALSNLSVDRQADFRESILSNRQTPLHAAVLAQNTQAVKQLAETNPEYINQRDKQGNTALNLRKIGVDSCWEYGPRQKALRAEIHTDLIVQGADVNIKNNSGDSPIQTAFGDFHEEENRDDDYTQLTSRCAI